MAKEAPNTKLTFLGINCLLN